MSKDLGPPKRYNQIKNKYPELFKHYEALSKATKELGILDQKTIALVKLGITIGAGMQGGTHSSTRKALQAGADKEEIHQTVLLSTTTIGFPNMMRALSWVDDILDKQ